MYELVIISENMGYGDKVVTKGGNKKVTFKNTSVAHITITAIDPAKGTCIEVVLRKDDLPEFVTNQKKE